MSRPMTGRERQKILYNKKNCWYTGLTHFSVQIAVFCCINNYFPLMKMNSYENEPVPVLNKREHRMKAQTVFRT